MTETRGTTATPERGRPPARPGRPGRVARFFAWLQALPGRVMLFIRQVVAELRKVVYPTREQLLTYTAVVLIFVGIVIAVVSLFDLAFGWAIFRIFA